MCEGQEGVRCENLAQKIRFDPLRKEENEAYHRFCFEFCLEVFLSGAKVVLCSNLGVCIWPDDIKNSFTHDEAKSEKLTYISDFDDINHVIYEDLDLIVNLLVPLFLEFIKINV